MNPQSCFSTEKSQLRVGKGHRGHKPAGNPSMEKESHGRWDFFQGWDPSVLLHIQETPSCSQRCSHTPETSQLAPKFSFPGRKCFKFPPNPPQPCSCSRWSCSCWAGSIQRMWKTQKLQVQGEKFPIFLVGEAPVAALCCQAGARGWRKLWGVKDTSRRPLRRGQGISWSSWERERIPSSGTGAPSDPQHEGGQGSWPGRGQDASG